MRMQTRTLAQTAVLTLAGISLVGLAAEVTAPAAGARATCAHCERSGPGLGEPATSAEIKALDWGIMPSGVGLPPGSGAAGQGQRLYTQHCSSCHGPGGQGNSAPRLASARQKLTDDWPEKTVGSYWPYATTLFDFIRRAKPMLRPGSLSDSQTYALTAYLLYLNGIITAEQVMNARSLPQVEMPNRHGFIRVLE